MKKRKVLSIREVTSTNTTFYDTIKNDIQNIVSDERKNFEQRCIPLPIYYSEFCDLFVSFGTYYLFRQNQNISFTIDERNELIIEQLFLYLTRDSSFEGDLHKGIMLQGKFGCGKTAIMGTYSLIHNHIVQRFGIKLPLVTFIKSVDLQEQIVKRTISSFVYRPLIIDEFGRESKTVQDFGNILRPVSELLSVRSDNGSLTHGTTNFTFDTLSSENFYGGMIGDRLKMMFNFITLHGESRRR